MLRLYTLLFILGSTHILFAQSSTAPHTLRVSLTVDQTPVADALSALSESYDLYIYYDPAWFAKQTISASITDKSVSSAINILLRESEFEVHWIKGNHYAIVGGSKAAFDYNVTLTGKILSSQNQQPVIGASISIPELGITTISDPNGAYELTFKAGTYLIVARTLEGSQASLVKQVYADDSHTFEVFDQITELDEVVVTFQRADDHVSATEAGKVAYTVESIKKLPNLLGEVDISQVIRAMPGVQTVGEGATGFNVRGGAIDQNLMLMDGIPIYNSSHLLGFTSVFNADVINDFEVFKGSMPAKYGGKLSSVVNVLFKNPSSNTFNFNGGIGPVANKLAINIPVASQNIGVLAGARYSNPTWILQSVKDADVRKSSASFSDFTMKARKNFNDKTLLSISSYLSNDTYDFGADTAFHYQTKAIAVNINQQLTHKLYGNATAYYSVYQADLTDKSALQGLTFENGIATAGLNLDFDLGDDENASWDFGLSVKQSEYTTGERTPRNDSPISAEDFGFQKGLEAASYVETTRKIGRRLSASFGIRGSLYGVYEEDLIILDDGHPKFDQVVVDTLTDGSLNLQFQNLEPRVTLNWTLNESSAVKANFSRTVQYEHLFTTSAASLPTDLWRPSNPNVLPGIANQVSVGYFKNLKNNMWSLSLETYVKQFENINVPRTGAEILENRLVDAEIISSEGTSRGIEFMARKNSGNVTGWISYFYSQTLLKTSNEFQNDNINNGEEFFADFDTPHNLNIALNYQASRLWSVSAAFTFRSGRPVTIPTSSYTLDGVRVFDVSSRNNFRIPNTHRLDISVTLDGSNKANKKWKNSFTFSLYNLYSQNNPFSLVTRAENNTIPKAFKVSVFGNVIPSFTYNFRFNQ